jgi:hypothetical protein
MDKLSDWEFETAVLKKLNEFQENTEYSII